jgi:hypothetical protein
MAEYATPAQLANYLAGNELDHTPAPEPPADAAVLIRQASSLVRRTTKAAVYLTDVDGMPVDPVLIEAMAYATAAAWSLAGINPMAGRSGVAPAIAAKTGGGVSVQYASYADDAKARSDLASGDVLASESWRALDDAGLLSTHVQSWPY